MALLAKNLMRSETGRAFMAVRDMDVAAERDRHSDDEDQAAGVRDQLVLLRRRRRAVRVSPTSVRSSPRRSYSTYRFRILFMVIIGGVGSILGCFLGAAFITLLPIFLNLASDFVAHTFDIEISHAASRTSS